MTNFHECRANALECQRMADISEADAEKVAWSEMAAHWLYVCPDASGETSPHLTVPKTVF